MISKGYDVTISIRDFTKKILLRESNYIVDLVLWRKLGNWHFYEKSFHILNFTRVWPE